MGIEVSDDGVFYKGNPGDLKKEITERFLSRENQSAASIAEENGVTVKTLYNWADKYAKNHPMKKRNPSSLQKMRFLITYDSLPEDQKGEFLRSEGLHSEQLESWRASVLDGSLETNTDRSLEKVVEQLNGELKETKKELRRKDKALAETAALLVLKKKLDSLWGEDEEDEPT